MALQELPSFEAEPGEQVLWSERRPRALASFARDPNGVFFTLGVITLVLQVVGDPPSFEVRHSLGFQTLSGLLALLAILLVAMLIVTFLRHANAEVVFTDRRALWREAGRTRQALWTSVIGVEEHPGKLILSCREPCQDERQGRVAELFAIADAHPERLVCPLRDPARVWNDLRAHSLVEGELLRPSGPEQAPLGPSLLRFVCGLGVLGAGIYAVDQRPSLGRLTSGVLFLASLALGVAMTIPAIRQFHARWTLPEDPGPSED